LEQEASSQTSGNQPQYPLRQTQEISDQQAHDPLEQLTYPAQAKLRLRRNPPKSLSDNNLLTHLYQKGGDIEGDFLQANESSSPFLKGDRRGFCCAVFLPNITAAYLLCKES
jgi:hypothetical protein